MIFIAAVELRKEYQVKKTKHGSITSNKNYMYFGINRKGGLTLQKVNSQNVLNLIYKKLLNLKYHGFEYHYSQNHPKVLLLFRNYQRALVCLHQL